jgi:hypothetical protein
LSGAKKICKHYRMSSTVGQGVLACGACLSV